MNWMVFPILQFFYRPKVKKEKVSPKDESITKSLSIIPEYKEV